MMYNADDNRICRCLDSLLNRCRILILKALKTVFDHDTGNNHVLNAVFAMIMDYIMLGVRK